LIRSTEIPSTATPIISPLQTRRDDEYVIPANGKSLMSSGMYGSEEELASMCWLRRA
jgi:hypothetical protein